MKLYNSNISPNCLRVRAVANELGIELEVIETDIFKNETKSDTFLALSVNAKVPLLVDEDLVLWESRAITAYLAGLRPAQGLYPDELRARAIVDQWSYWQAIHLGPPMQKIAFERYMKQRFGMGEPNEDAIAAELKETDRFLRVLEDNLSDKEWVAGKLSIADFAMASTFMFREQAQMSLEEMPSVSSWIEKLEQRSSWQKAVEPMIAALPS